MKELVFLIPELFAKYYISFKRLIPEETWCDCQQPADDKPMIKCSNELCSITLFHVDCTGLTEVGDDTSYLCQTCTKILINEFQ